MPAPRLLLHYVFGLLMGTADVIPGVSGGTMALIVGIYARLIASVGHGAGALGRALRLDVAAVRGHLREIEWGLVLPLGAGIVSALAVGSAVIPGLLDDHPERMRALFFGLIAGSIVIPWRRMRARGALTMAVLLVAAGVAFVFAGLPDREVASPALWQVFAAASLAICAMILPGVSGAFLLLILGMYEPTLDALHERDLPYIAVFAAGAVAGISVFSSVLRYLLERAHDLTMAALVGLMAGSLRALWPYLEDDRALRGPAEGDPMLSVLLLVAGGAAAVLALAVVGDRTDRADRAERTTS
ncbi:MAG: DUF368 domain-containing protein [Dehalococcoidia bacterium]